MGCTYELQACWRWCSLLVGWIGCTMPLVMGYKCRENVDVNVVVCCIVVAVDVVVAGFGLTLKC